MANFSNLLNKSNGGGGAVYIIFFGFIAFLIVMMLLQNNRRKKAEAEYKQKIDEMQVGMRVKTYSGVIGIIREIREEAPNFKTVLIETGDEKSKDKTVILYDLYAINGIVDTAKIEQAKKASENAAPNNNSAQQKPDVQQNNDGNKGVDNAENAFKPQKSKK
jgi:preprotein translocase subunit YajC